MRQPECTEMIKNIHALYYHNTDVYRNKIIIIVQNYISVYDNLQYDTFYILSPAYFEKRKSVLKQYINYHNNNWYCYQ